MFFYSVLLNGQWCVPEIPWWLFNDAPSARDDHCPVQLIEGIGICFGKPNGLNFFAVSIYVLFKIGNKPYHKVFLGERQCWNRAVNILLQKVQFRTKTWKKKIYGKCSVYKWPVNFSEFCLPVITFNVKIRKNCYFLRLAHNYSKDNETSVGSILLNDTGHCWTSVTCGLKECLHILNAKRGTHNIVWWDVFHL